MATKTTTTPPTDSTSKGIESDEVVTVAEPTADVAKQEPTCAEEEKNITCAAPHVIYNPEKKLWQTPDGWLFNTLRKAENHVKTMTNG